MLKVEKSKSRHAQDALESSTLLYTCILSKKTVPVRTVTFGALCSHRGFPSRESKKWKGGGEIINHQSKVIHADRVNRSLQCVQLLTLTSNVREKNGRTLSCGVIQSAAVWPRRTVRCARLYCSEVKSAHTISGAHTHCAHSGDSGEQGKTSNDAALQRARLLLLSDVTSLLSHPLSPVSLPLSRSLSHHHTHLLSSALSEYEDRLRRVPSLLLVNYFCPSLSFCLSLYHSWAIIGTHSCQIKSQTICPVQWSRKCWWKRRVK